MEMVNVAISNILRANEFNFQSILFQLPPKQKELLIAICKEGKAKTLTSSAFIHRYVYVDKTDLVWKSDYWFDSGTPSYLIRQMQHFRTDITTLDSMDVPATAFDKPTEAMTTALPLLYQSGYLTIKDYERESATYTLGIPNQEVRVGYAEGLLPAYVGLDGSDVQTGFALKFWRSLKRGDIDQAMRDMQSYLAGIPYVEGFKRKLEEVSNAEGFYEYTFYLIFSMLNVYARTQVKVWSSEHRPSSLEDGRVATELGKAKCSGGRADIVVWMPDAIYVMELKVNGTAQEALKQIVDKGYARPYANDGRRVVKIGISFSLQSKSVEDWVIS